MATEKVINIVVKKNTTALNDLGSEISEQKKITLEFQRELNTLQRRLESTSKGNLNQQRKLRGQIKHVKDAIKDQNLSLKELSLQQVKSNKGIANSSGLANTAVQELGRGISDSAYGIQGVANNVSQLGSLFGMLVTKTGTVTMALRAMWSSLMGPLGLLVGFQAVTAFIQTDYFKALLAGGKATKELNDLNKKSNEIAGDNLTMFKLLTGVLLDANSTKEEQAKAVKKLNKEFEGFNTELVTNAENYKEATKQVELYTKQIISQAKAEAALELIKEKQAEILKLEQERIDKLGTSSFDEAEIEKGRLSKVKDIYTDYFEEVEREGGSQQERLKIKREGDIKDFNNFVKEEGKILNKSKIDEINKEIDNLTKLGDIKSLILEGGSGSSKEKKGKSDIDLEKERQEAINKIREEFRRKNEDEEDEFNIEKLERQYNRDLEELENLRATEEQKFEIRKYYEKLINDEREKIMQDFEDEEEQRLIDIEDKRLQDALARIQLEEKVAQAKEDIANKTASLLIELAGRGSKIGKALAIANIIREQISSAAKAKSNLVEANIKAVSASPLTAGQPWVGINTAQALLGIAGSAFSAKQAISQINSGSAGSLSGGGGQQPTNAPSFNLVQGTQQNQIAESISGLNNNPVKAIVVATDVTNAQQANRNKVNQASL